MERGRIEVPVELTGLGAGILSDLARAGLLRQERGGAVPQLRVSDEGLLLFVPLLERYQVRLVPMVRDFCPVRFCTGLLNDRDIAAPSSAPLTRPIPAGGQGDFDKNASLSCLGELAERLSLCSLGVDDPRIFVDRNEQPEVDFLELMGLSAAQAAQMAGTLTTKIDAHPDGMTGWRSLSDRRIGLRNLVNGHRSQFPSFGVLFQESELATDGALPFASSVGSAVWTSLGGARERALLELAERDAVAQAWYNRLGITCLKPELLRDVLPASLSDYLNAQIRSWGVYRLSTDLPVQVAMAVSHDGAGHRCAFGSSAGWDLAAACKGAIHELLQSENALELMEKAYPSNRTDARVPSQLTYARTGSILEDLPIETAPDAVPADASSTYGYEQLMQFIEDRNFTIWEFEATRPDLAIPCVKLLSPDLCTWEPRFGKRRLYEGVVERGLRRQQASEAEFAARPFPF
jgi:ribosomal protein S12 methylthiotransferase accessory factor